MIIVFEIYLLVKRESVTGLAYTRMTKVFLSRPVSDRKLYFACQSRVAVEANILFILTTRCMLISCTRLMRWFINFDVLFGNVLLI